MSAELLIILIWIISAIIFIIIPTLNTGIIRTILGLPMLFFIPGYVLISALFPKKGDLDILERLGLSLGMSVSIVPLIGLILNYTFGIKFISITASLTIFDLFMIFITNYRRGLLSEDQRFDISPAYIYGFLGRLKCQKQVDKILTILLIFSMALAIGMLIYDIASSKTGEKFTEFYILNSTTGTADNYSKTLKIESPTTLIVGVINHEFSVINYTIQINMDKNVLLSKEIELDNNETWENNMTFIPNKKGNYMKLEFLLFKDKNFTIPYRELHLWENVTDR